MSDYDIIGESGFNSSTVKTTFSENFDPTTGDAWVSMTIKVNLGESYTVDFASPDQVRDCVSQMQAYLDNRNNFYRSKDPGHQAAEPLHGYGND